MALSWAWFVAGSPAVVLNRWEGNDEFVYELHRRLKTTESTAEQIRQTALKFRRESPSRWAGYMVLGN